MMTALLLLFILFWTYVAITARRGVQQLPLLEDEREQFNGKLVSVIIAARDEAASIEATIRAVFRQSYEAIELIVVNDRSNDETMVILDRLQRELTFAAVHIHTLPAGWLGKNHALYEGYKRANGDYLLFIDADIHLQPDTLGRAVHFIERTGVAHVTVAPNLALQGRLLQAFVSFFLFGFAYYKRPWLANDDTSSVAMGIGAFNLVTTDGYEQIGTHEAIALRPDDDLMLGLRIKQAGLKQRIVSGLSLVRVPWYYSLGEAIRGLEKNTFAGLHYSLPLVLFSLFGIFTSQLLPFLLLLSFRLEWIVLSLLIIGQMAYIYRLIVRAMSTMSPRLFYLFPVSAILFMATIIRSTYLTYRQGGIYWRGTFYSLEELRKGK